MKVPIKGSFTEVTQRTFDVDVKELTSNAMKYFTVNDTIAVLKLHLERKYRHNDPTIPENAVIDWHTKSWEVFAFNDYHKNEDVYKTVRKFNESELQYLMAIESVYHVLNN